MTIRTKLRVLFAAIIIIVAALGGFNLTRLAVVKTASDEVSETWVPRRAAIFRLTDDMEQYRLGEARHILSTSPEGIVQADHFLHDSNGKIETDFAAYRKLLSSNELPKAVQLEEFWKKYVLNEEPMLALSRANHNDEATAQFNANNEPFSNVLRLAEDIVSETALNITQARKNISDVYDVAVYVSVGAIAVTVLLAIAAGLYFERSISRAIIRLSGCMGLLAKGELSVEVPGTDRTDEIGQMAATVLTFRENAEVVVRMGKEAEGQRQASEAQRQAAEAARETAAAELRTCVTGLGRGLSQLAEGNLTFALDTPFAAEYEQLRNNFNSAVEGLQVAMRNVINHSGAIHTGTGEIAGAADDLAKRTEQQAASLQQTAAALDEITKTVQQTASGSMRAQSIADTAASEAKRSEKVVGETVSAMSEIESSARQISQIIGVIDEIAFQTNLLALNAGVEAARAGEAGRGFAVVASEVRALAQRAADAAKEIKTLISASMQQVERGVRLVGETGQALGRIQTGVSEINAAVREIAASAKEQSTGLSEVNHAVNQMDQVTQQNAAMVEESTAATRALASETDALNRAIACFQTEETIATSRRAA